MIGHAVSCLRNISLLLMWPSHSSFRCRVKSHFPRPFLTTTPQHDHPCHLISACYCVLCGIINVTCICPIKILRQKTNESITTKPIYSSTRLNNIQHFPIFLYWFYCCWILWSKTATILTFYHRYSSFTTTIHTRTHTHVHNFFNIYLI